MREEAVCAVYYTRIKSKLTGANLHQFQKNLALDMLRQGFSDFLCIELDESKIKTSSKGKPYYEEESDCYFNITHCKDAVAVAISKFPVGIDVESMRQIKCRTAEKCLGIKEMQYVRNSEINKLNIDLTTEEVERFLHLWTLKESYVKMTGEGIRIPLNTICFIPQEFRTHKDIWLCPNEIDTKSASCLYFPKNLILALTVQTNTVLSNTSILRKEFFYESNTAI